MINRKRLIGIDFGMKRIGVAVSDPMRSFCHPPRENR